MDVSRIARPVAAALLIALHLLPVQAAGAALSVLGPAPEASIASAGPAWAVELDRDAWRDGLARGQVTLPMPDGRAVQIEGLREAHAADGVWTLVGRVHGPGGVESAVITFGDGGVFAVLPTPAGLREIRTESGRQVMRAAGTIRPPEGVVCAGGPCPSWLDRTATAKSAARPAGDTDALIPDTARKRAGLPSMSLAELAAIHAAGPVRIDVLGLISSELARDATGEAAARTEFRHLVAVANQAHADSGTNLVFNVVGIDTVRIDPAMSGRRSLDAVTQNDPLLEWDVHARRDETAADLVALIRPYSANAWECGLGWLGGYGLAPDAVDPAYGYSLTRTAPCGPHVLAHELGHNLGSHHDIANALDGQGNVQRGAYLESHGFRRVEAPGFATVMAYESGSAQRIGRFSDPGRAECQGTSCGVAGYADNVASLRRMGPRIARFRDVAAGVTIRSGDVREGESSTDVPFIVRWPTPAPAQGRKFRVGLVAATAAAGQDFEPYSEEVVLAEGQTEWSGRWRVVGDSLEESDETLELVVQLDGTGTEGTIRETLTIVDDDPKVRISGAVVFSGSAAPESGASLHWLYADAAGIKRFTTAVSGPSFAFGFDVPSGARVVLERTTVAAPFAGVDEDLGVATAAMQRTITLNSRIRLAGRLAFDGTHPPPATPLKIDIRGAESPNAFTTVDALPPDFAFAADVRFGNAIDITVRNLPSPWYDQQGFKLGAMTANTNRVFPIGVGMLLHGRVTFDPLLPPPTPNPNIWISQYRKVADGYTQLSYKAMVENGAYAVSVRPDATVWVDGSSQGITDSTYRFLGVLRSDTRVDFHFSPAADVTESVVFNAIRGAPPFDFTQRIRVPLDRPVGSNGARAQLVQVSGAAQPGLEYSGMTTLVALPGARYAFVEVTIKPNEAVSGRRTAVFSIEPSIGLRTSAKTITLNIDGDDATKTILYTPTPVTWGEGSAGTREMPLQVSLSKPAGPGGAKALFAVSGWGARWNMPFAEEGSDISLPTPMVEFAPGQRVATLIVRLHGDTEPEYDEEFNLAVSQVVGIDGARPASVTSGNFRILNDDDAVGFARADRFDVMLDASRTKLDLAYRANDATLGETPWLEGGVSIAQAPRHGTLELVNEQQGALVEVRAKYLPPARLPQGRDRFRYRSCGAYWSNPCTEADVDVRMLAFPASSHDLRVDRDRGHRDFERSGHPSIQGLRFETTPLVPPLIDRMTLGFDATPVDAFDDDAGTSTRLAAVDPVPEARRWMLHARAVTAASGDIDLYVGVDRNGNGRADRDEIVCSAAMSASLERCDALVDQPPGAGFTWWVRMHNRGVAQDVRLERYRVPLAGTPGFAVSSKAQVRQGEPWRWRVGWTLPGLAHGESMVGALRVTADDGLDLGWVPVRFERESDVDAAAPIAHASHRAFALATGATARRAFFDVPPGIERLELDIEASASVDVSLIPLDAPAATSAAPLIRTIANEPPAATATAVNGRHVLVVNAPRPGQWFVRLANPAGSSSVARVRVVPRLVAGPSVARIAPGSYFNAARSGHGLFVYPAGPDWAGLWYTYLADGSATWYYLQGSAPGADGVWHATLFRSRWYGSANQLTAVGTVSVSAREGGGLVFTHLVDGESGSEPMVAFGRGCPSIDGRVVDASGHWFDPRSAGTGYSVQLFPNYEFYAVFGYDDRGEARYLAAEHPAAGAATQRVPLVQLRGFCPLCARETDPQRREVGNLERDVVNGRLVAVRVQANYADGVEGAWAANDAVIPLGGLQGCAVD